MDIIEATVDYIASNTLQEEAYEPDPESLLELSRARVAFDREMEISRRVMASTLEEVNIGTTTDPPLLSIAKNLLPSQKEAILALLKEYKDVFAWFHENMKGLDPKFYQHKNNLSIY